MSGQDVEAPDEWIISRVCEEFPCYGPKEAIQAMQEDEGEMLFKIIEYRAYARAKETYESTPMEKRAQTPMMMKIHEMQMRIAKEKIDAHLEKERLKNG